MLCDCKITFITAPSARMLISRDITHSLIDPVILTFNLLTSYKMDNQNLQCTIHLPSLVVISPVVFLLECILTPTYTVDYTKPLDAILTPATTLAWIINWWEWQWKDFKNCPMSGEHLWLTFYRPPGIRTYSVFLRPFSRWTWLASCLSGSRSPLIPDLTSSQHRPIRFISSLTQSRQVFLQRLRKLWKSGTVNARREGVMGRGLAPFQLWGLPRKFFLKV